MTAGKATKRFLIDRDTAFYQFDAQMGFGGVPNHEREICFDARPEEPLISRFITALYSAKPRFKIQDKLELLSKHPDWQEINSHIQQKGLAA